MSAATIARPTAAPARPPGSGLGIDAARDDVRRTALVALGTVLGFLPMRTVFSDVTWLVEVVGALLCVFVPAAVLRLRRGPSAAQLLPGLLLVVVYACTLYLHARAFAGFLPSPGAWHAIGHLRIQASQQVADNVAPMTSTRALRLEIVPGLAILAAVIDYLAVVRRAPALAGIPLLALFTICGASAGTSVGWFAFACAGTGFLLILSADSRINLARWGRVIPRRSGDHPSAARFGQSGRRIGVVALVLAVVVPSMLPGLSRNLLASAFHRYSSSAGGAGGTGLSPFANLRGNLNNSATIELMSVHVDGAQDPFYLRSKILDEFTTTGWRASGLQTLSDPLDQARFETPLRATRLKTVQFQAQLRVERLKDDAAPAFGTAADVANLSGNWRWNYELSTISGDTTQRGSTYTERVEQADPSAAALLVGDKEADKTAVNERWTALPDSIPAQVRTTVTDLTQDRAGAYAKARALSDYFTNPINGFVYDLQTKAGDSGSDLMDFLTNRTGFCQQYAAAMAVMLRLIDIPARVVLGYTHQAPDGQGNLQVTNHDAHAWVEAFLPDVGWLPFDPTPIDPSRATQLPYAPHVQVSTTNNPAADKKEPSRSRPLARDTAPGAAGAAASTGNNGSTLRVPTWLMRLFGVVLALSLLGCILPVWRAARRRERVRRARRQRSVEPLWSELHAAATDRGAGWSATTTPRQVPAWLAGVGIKDTGQVGRLARQLERERYAAQGQANGLTDEQISDFSAGVQAASAELGRGQDRSDRVRTLLLPASIVSGRRQFMAQLGTDVAAWLGRRGKR